MGDVKTTLFQMHPKQALGLDDLNALFYQRYWQIVKDRITALCLEVLNNNCSPSAIKHTLISLIPKFKTPSNITNFHPISLCNISYKIVAKCRANRMKSILVSCILEEQSAFVPGRLIMDNVVVRFGCAHNMKSYRYSKQHFLLLKLNMSKAYDRIE